MTVGAQRYSLDARDVFHEVRYERPHFLRQSISHRIGDVYNVRSGLYGLLDHPGKISPVRPSGILRRELHVIDEAAGVVLVEETLDRDEVLGQAPERQGAYFKVPPFLEDS